MQRILFAASAALVLSGCAATAIPPARAPIADKPATRAPISVRGLEAVMGKDVAALKRLFGEPRLDVVEVNGRKLQFTGTACVLDAYLYPEGSGGREIVTYIDARRSDGAEVDRAACVNALQR
jgi:Prokaryotic membrane lipoprotein lipid attachment site